MFLEINRIPEESPRSCSAWLYAVVTRKKLSVSSFRVDFTPEEKRKNS